MATAVEAALAAGRIHRRYFRQQVKIEKKGPIDLVTAADLEVEREFRALIGRRFPAHVVLGEEGGADDAARPSKPLPSSGEGAHRWIIDPVDGTTNFAHGLALFCVSIALEIDGALAVGVVYDPIADELFTAECGQGARLNGHRLRVSPETRLLDALLCTGFPYSIRERRTRQIDTFAAFLGQSRAVRRLGSAALDLCYVAAGRFDGFWEEQLHAWDMAAGALIVAEAGGRVTGYNDEPLDLFGHRIIATNGGVHDAVLGVIKATSGAAS
ncbi:MAG TPA: inositol monophosphatase family protein [Vicinamibacterales bacterium]|nr:inositol monophosphatase family protein [Vicinamibacterales bacterium]